MRRPRRRRREQQQRRRRRRGWRRRPQGLRLPQPARCGGLLGGPAPPRIARRLAHGAPAAGAAVRSCGAWLRLALRPQVHLQVRLPGLGLHGRSSASPAARGQLGVSGSEVIGLPRGSLTWSPATGLTLPVGRSLPLSLSACPTVCISHCLHGGLSGCCPISVLYRGRLAVFLNCFSPVGGLSGCTCQFLSRLYSVFSSIPFPLMNACSVMSCKPLRSLSRFWESRHAFNVMTISAHFGLSTC